MSPRRLKVVSPHSDDAALSLAGSLKVLAERGATVELISCFTQTAWAPKLPPGLSCDEVTAVRQQEDLAFARWLPGDVGIRFLALADAPLRGENVLPASTRSEWEMAALKGEVELLSRCLRSDAHADGAEWWLPLSGVHRDHAIALEAGLRGAGGKLILYEDVPYCLWLSQADIEARCRVIESRIGLRLERRQVAAWDPASWIACVWHYASQFGPRELSVMRRMMEERGGEWIWEAG